MANQVQVFSSIVQYLNMQCETNNNRRKSAVGPVRCLFGVPDPHETRTLIEEELRKQRESFFSRWQCDIDTKCAIDLVYGNENSKKRKLENEENEFQNSAKKLLTVEDKLGGASKEDVFHNNPRRILQPRNEFQSHLTDFWSSKKTSCDERNRKHLKYPNQQL